MTEKLHPLFFTAMKSNTLGGSQRPLAEISINIPTHKHPVPKDRAPQMYHPPKKSDCCLFGAPTAGATALVSQSKAWKLRSSFILMLKSFSEHSPQAKNWKKAEMLDFIESVEICLGLRSGKLNLQQYGNLLIKLDTIAPFKDGDLTRDLETIDQIVQAYAATIS